MPPRKCLKNRSSEIDSEALEVLTATEHSKLRGEIASGRGGGISLVSPPCTMYEPLHRVHTNHVLVNNGPCADRCLRNTYAYLYPIKVWVKSPHYNNDYYNKLIEVMNCNTVSSS